MKREKHFIVVDVIRDENDFPQQCVLEAIRSKKEYRLHWRELKNSEQWTMGWN